MVDVIDSDQDALVKTVVGVILEGHARRDILDWLSATHPDDGRDPSEVYDAATEMIIQSYRVVKPALRGYVIAGLQEMYRRLVEIGDYAAAAKVLMSIEKIRK